MSIFTIVVVALVVWVIKGQIDKKKEVAFLRTEAKNKEDARLKKSALPTLATLRDSLSKPYNVDNGTPYVSIDDWNDLFGRTLYTDEKFLQEIGTTKKELEYLRKEYFTRHNFFAITCKINCSRTEVEFKKAITDRSLLLVKNNKTLADFGIDRDDHKDLRKKFLQRLIREKIREVMYTVEQAQKAYRLLKNARLELGFEDGDCGLIKTSVCLNTLSTTID